MKKQNLFIVALFLISLFLLQGCKGNIDEMEKDVLSFDPSFQKVLDKRDDLQKNLNSNKFAYMNEIESIEGQMGILKERKLKAKLDYQAANDSIKRQLQPEIRRLNQEILDKKREYKHKKMILSEIERDIKDVSGLIDKKDTLVLTSEEVSSWNKRLSALKKRKLEVNQSIAQLRKDIEVSRLKLKVLVFK